VTRARAHGLLGGVRSRTLITWLALALLSCAGRSPMHPFSSDGCTLFPDGPPGDRRRWCECCLVHDMAYWRGGTEAERQAADLALRACVLERSHDPGVAEAIYMGARLGGSPIFPTGYRWGYAWPYGRGFEPVTEAEQAQVLRRLADYRRARPRGFCAEP
jgi:hypothetical protein